MKTTDRNRNRTKAGMLSRAQGLAISARAFTVIELLVAIGAVVIVSVGLAAIFDAVGKTVTGGRRLSVLSQYATMVENQMRRDISSIDPNSFIMIRQQWVDKNLDGRATLADDAVDLYQGQASGLRKRRIDEMVFFCRGDFATARTAVAPESIAKSREARVYYGHGERMTENYTSTPAGEDYLKPAVAYQSAITDAELPPLGTGINRYASEWTLLRHVTVLDQPASTAVAMPDLSFMGLALTPDQAADKDAQIALQPAAANIFRTTHFITFPADIQSGNYIWQGANTLFPSFATGTVDIATTDITEIRTMVMGLNNSPYYSLFYDPDRKTFGGVGTSLIRFAQFGRGRRSAASPNNIDSLELMHLWMADAFPTQSLATPPADLGAFVTPAQFDPINRRIRCEVQPVNLRSTVEEPLATPADVLQNSYERSAQAMLSAHNFVPRCSEFIVEWSFGRTNPATNELIWHGPPRAGATTSQLCFYPFVIDAAASPPVLLEEGKNFDFVYDANPDPNTTTLVQERRFHAFTDRLIYGETPAADQAALTSYFGYIDPTYDPRHPLLDDPRTPGDESTGSATSSDLIEWPRPKLIRVTMSLADPRTPSSEETFQFVFEVPQDRSK